VSNIPSPKIYIYWSFVLQEYIVRSKYDEKKLQSFTYEFSKFFKKYEKKVLKYIEKYSGFKWKEKRITVWLFDGFHESIPDPFFLNVYNYDKEFMLFKFIHLLLHRILLQNGFHRFTRNEFLDKAEFDAILYFITKRISEYFFDKNKIRELCKKSESIEHYKSVWETEQEIEKRWDIRKSTLKDYISSMKLG